MNLPDLIKHASLAYPDMGEGFVERYYHLLDRQEGDVIACFICDEIDNTYNPDASDEKKIDIACRALQRGIDGLQDVIRGLQSAKYEN